jgi:hypothetical protein|tara:strand:- start:116 stop:478 length:363 start_codon:yes stop_codon:yes gene_type:complete
MTKTNTAEKCNCWKCANLTAERLHEGFLWCQECQDFYLGTFDIKDTHNMEKNLCINCLGRMDMKSYMDILKNMTARDLFIHETPVKQLPLEVVKSIDFVSEKDRKDLIEYLVNGKSENDF